MLRFFCCSGTHGRPPLPIDDADARAWLHAGDVCSGRDVAARAASSKPLRENTPWEFASDAELDEWIGSRKAPLYLVRGNHDVSDPYRAFARGRDVTGLVVPLAENLLLAGLGWAGQYYFDLPLEHNIAAACGALARQVLRNVANRDGLILLTHYPAPLVGAGSGGSSFSEIRDLIDEFRPLLVVQGHGHRSFETSSIRKFEDGSESLILNPGPNGAEVIVDISRGRAELVRYLPRGKWDDRGTALPQ